VNVAKCEHTLDCEHKECDSRHVVHAIAGPYGPRERVVESAQHEPWMAAWIKQPIGSMSIARKGRTE
jgi:hypothetical protein